MTLNIELVGLLNQQLKYWDLPEVFRAEMSVEQLLTALAVMAIVPDAGRAHQRKILADVLDAIDGKEAGGQAEA